MQQLRIGIAGLGTVAQGVLQILAENRALIAARAGVDVCVTRVASRRARPEVALGEAVFSTELADLYRHDDVDVVVELIGGETVAYDLIRAARAAGKSVVTANKAVIAAHGNTLLAESAVPLRFEAAVAGAIPIIQAMRQGLVANRFEHVVGIINGTCNYILTAMQEQGAAFADALATAQQLGYAEADPSFDVDGIDAAHKLAILLGLAFDTPFNFADIYVEGITAITREDIVYADELGYRIKHLGLARMTPAGLEARVHPTLVPKTQLLASVNDVLNAVLVKCDAAGDILYSGPGAGGAATASAVLSDVVALGSQRQPAATPRSAASATVEILSIDDSQSAYYLRIPAKDQPGVFAQVANALSRHDISIEAAIQKQPKTRDDLVAIVIVTQVVRDAEMVAAMAELQSLPQVQGSVARIRLESLE